MKKKDSPENKKSSFSQKWLVVLIIVGVALAVVGLGIVIKSPDNPKPSEKQPNQITSKTIPIPSSGSPSQIPAPPAAVEAETVPGQLPPKSDGPVETTQTASDLKDKFSAMVASVEDSPTQMPTQPMDSKEAIMQNLRAQQTEAWEAYDPETDDPEMDDREMDAPEMDDREIDDREIDDREIDDREMDAPEMDDPEMDDPEMDDRQSGYQEKSEPYSAEQLPTTDTGYNEGAPFTVQVGVFRYDVYAERSAAKLQQLDYPSFIHEIIGKDQHPLYLVCFGRFASRTEAALAADKFKVKENMDAVPAFLRPY